MSDSIVITGEKLMKPLKTKISLTIDDPILEQVKILAEEKDRSVSSYINQVLKAHLKQIDQKEKK